MLEQFIANNYLRALVILLGVFILLKILAFIIEKIILNITKKTKTDLDDKIVKKSRKPVSLLVFLIGIKIALTELSLADKVALIISKVISVLFIISVAYLIYVILDTLIFGWGKKWAAKTKSTLDDNLINLIHKFTKIALIILTILYILDSFGIKVGPLLAGLGIAGIAVAFALQSTLSNIFGGISLILDKTVKVGDTVYIDKDTKGIILDIGLRSTKLKTFDNEVIIIPNGKLADMKIQNIVLPEEKTRVVVPFNVAYGSNIDQVKKIIINEIYKIKNISKEHEPIVRFREMGDSALFFKVYFYVNTYKQRFGSIDEANTLIYNALNRNRISIPFKQMDVHLKKE